jgi:hypothetical protein
VEKYLLRIDRTPQNPLGVPPPDELKVFFAIPLSAVKAGSHQLEGDFFNA